jgi:sulfatase maturation enzyme AslB (radical SAM superfamily)
MTDLYCSIIHGGLNLNFKNSPPSAKHCCLRSDHYPLDLADPWNVKNLQHLRQLNQQNKWDLGCQNCKSLEKSNLPSFRTGMNSGLGIYNKINLTGPARIDLMFDISCNLACRSCGTHSSTFWQKHLKNHGAWKPPISTPGKKNDIITALSNLDLSNLRQLVFCGGETLLGKDYWEIANWLGDNVPNAKQKLTLCFQTNGTQPILEKNYKIIEKFYLVKLHVSIDGIGTKFEYLRWPATWNQVAENILHLKETVPSNVMFVIEETISVFNLPYQHEVDNWVINNFSTNREGDMVNHTKHLAHEIFSLDQMTSDYVAAISTSKYSDFIPPTWQENSAQIQSMIEKIKLEDRRRSQSFAITFPEVASYYSKFL